jgi:hypothetical protein
MSRCIVVQGQTNPQYVKQIKECFKGNHIIFSTWEGTDRDIWDEWDVVLYNPIPADKGVANLNLQRVSSLKGFLKGKEMGFKRVLKWRSDFICANGEELLKLFPEDKMNFYAWHGVDKYVMDFFMEGDMDEMINLFSFDGMNARFPEQAFTNRMFHLGLDSKAHFVCKDIFEPNDIKWLKHNYWLSQNTLDNRYENKITL